MFFLYIYYFSSFYLFRPRAVSCSISKFSFSHCASHRRSICDPRYIALNLTLSLIPCLSLSHTHIHPPTYPCSWIFILSTPLQTIQYRVFSVNYETMPIYITVASRTCRNFPGIYNCIVNSLSLSITLSLILSLSHTLFPSQSLSLSLSLYLSTYLISLTHSPL